MGTRTSSKVIRQVATQSRCAAEVSTERIAVSIVIPAYNEEQGIDLVLTGLCEVMSGSGLRHEIIVVDDGSSDKTATIAAQHPDTTVLRHRANRGYGAALKTGIRHAHYDLICITDADGSYPNKVIPSLVKRLVEHQCDMVVGARIGQKVSIPMSRRPAKWILGRLADFVAGTVIPDLNSGLRVFRSDIALRMFDVLPESFSFTTTITLAMLTNGYLVDYVPIDYYPRIGRSKIRPLHDTIAFVRLVLSIALYFRPIKVFLPISGLLLILALAWALFSKFVLGQLADVTTVVVATTAIQVAVIGMLAELVNRRLPNVYRNN